MKIAMVASSLTYASFCSLSSSCSTTFFAFYHFLAVFVHSALHSFIHMEKTKRPRKMMRRLAVVGIHLFRRSPQGELSLAEDVSEDVMALP